MLDNWVNGFLYIVSSSSTTGAKKGFEAYQIEYIKRLDNLKLKNRKIIGFGISDGKGFNEACKYANGAIIGSAFVKALDNPGDIKNKIADFIKNIR